VIIAPNGLAPADIGLDERAVDVKLTNFHLHSPLRFLYMGRLSVEKGVSILLNACALMRDKGINFQLDIIGSGPEKGTLERLCAELTLQEPLVRFLGQKSRKELGAYLLDSDILFVPSLSEPLGNVVLEGMLSGCFVTASATGGILSTVIDGKTGLLVDTGNEQDLAKKVEVVLGSETEMGKIANVSREYVRRHFSWEVIGKNIILRIDNLIKEPLNKPLNH